jgi:hypothetical protein
MLSGFFKAWKMCLFGLMFNTHLLHRNFLLLIRTLRSIAMLGSLFSHSLNGA